GKINITDLKNKINDEISSVVIGYPNFYGIIEDIEEIRKIIPKNILLIVVANPIMLGAFQSPGKLGADIVVGEGQPLGN
ncbi:glycine dehydrogenase, partial [Streptomyces scabiei]